MASNRTFSGEEVLKVIMDADSGDDEFDCGDDIATEDSMSEYDDSDSECQSLDEIRGMERVATVQVRYGGEENSFSENENEDNVFEDNIHHEEVEIQQQNERDHLDHWEWTQCQEHDRRDIPFSERERVLVDINAEFSASDYFRLYITEEIVTHMVSETNRYAAQYISQNQENLRPHSNMHAWQPTDGNEIFSFLGILLLMGLVYKPRIPMYWSQTDILHTPIFSKVMSRNRFLLLLKFFHLTDNSTYDAENPNRDRLFKVRQFVNLIKARTQAVFQPGRELCLDESLVLFKGRLSFKQYIKTKRARFGIKFFELCTSKGILIDFLIYHGKMNDELVQDQQFLFTEKIVITLMNHHLNKGHIVYIDNYYTSPRLLAYLLQHGTLCTGTVRPHRKLFPQALSQALPELGNSIFFTANGRNILAIKYRSHVNKSGNKPKVVHLLSTAETTETQIVGQDRQGNDIVKPKAVVSYNKNMGGVDLMDQQLDSLQVLRKTYKWYKKCAFRLILQCLLSSHKIYCFQGGSHDFLKYTQNVVSQLVAMTPRLNHNVILDDTVVRLTGRNHFPMKREYTGHTSKKRSSSKVCRVCYARGIRQTSGKPLETSWVCKGCPSFPGLHVEKDCFEVYHTKLDYSQ